jgi:hypothetical protein
MAEEDFAWTRLDASGWKRPGDGEGFLREDTFQTFLVQVKTDTDIGREMLNDPIGVLRREIKEMGIPDADVRAMTLRVNAEVPANPRHSSQVWITYPGSMTAIGIQFKYENDEGATA